jgi:hypothetical protein
MRISITPITVETDNGPVTCTVAEVSVAVSSSVAMRIVPVGADGTEYVANSIGIVGTSEQAEIAAFLDSVSAASQTLMQSQGV